MSDAFLRALKNRRSIYNLGDTLPNGLTEGQVTALIEEAVRRTPSSFNSQTVRAVIVYGAENQKVWATLKDAMRALKLPEDALKKSFAKIDNGFAGSVGTVLFYEDTDVTKDLMKKLPEYATNFPIFAQHGAGMAQLAVWIALSEAGLGASLQHYNALIATAMQKAFNTPSSWSLVAQMPFGSIKKPAGPKTFIPDEGRFIVRGTSKL